LRSGYSATYGQEQNGQDTEGFGYSLHRCLLEGFVLREVLLLRLRVG
jgi:hypothetical protein